MSSLVSDLRNARSGTVLVQWMRGLSLPFRSVALLWRHRSLWNWAAAPAIIGILLFTGVAVAAVAYSDDLLALWWTQPTSEGLWGGILLLGWIILYVILMLLGVAGAYLTALLLGGIVASPFNDALSIRAEDILTGDSPSPDEVSMWTGLGRSLVSTTAVTVVYVLCAVPVLALNIIPWIGPPVAAVLHAGLAAFFLGLEYADVALARYGLRWKEKLDLLNRHRPLALGFGLSTSLLFWIPLLNLVVMPVAVVGGTALGLALHEPK
ncbi:hypothetical protein CRI94_10870 [Longibacter salinarum]|uniref:Sulfate transporter CysZ n=1 Tax=Longibacter salinarum TaxID=1850348 RepID=A0A2A8CX02_9BACT|nr:EI24 domain-containing protein [Longibacter salinarum]PEN13141.1 hypothetical protein CRI94_10870 [Longibacter salinarum]